jgi:hypothetical protein
MQKDPFASARVIAQHFLTTVPTIQDILQRKFSRRGVPHFLSPVQKVARVEASKTICEFYKTRNQMTSKELHRVMTPGSGTVIHLQQCLRGRHPRLFQDAANNWRENKQ